ncbi:MAG TPA: DUF732 domain-containing protein [Mycobacteriales bacterium]|nr:DUF732 domain-containing protein [Mycobacteriales bacterium]
MGGQHTRTTIATGAFATLGVALAVTLGAVPRIADDSHAQVRAVQLASVIKVGADALHSHERVAPHGSVVPHSTHHTVHLKTATIEVAPAVQSATTHAVTAENVSARVASDAAANPTTKKPAAKPAKKHHAKKKHHKKAPKKTKPAAPAKAARTVPSAAEVAGAVSGLKQYVHTVFSITSSEVAQFGNDVCSAFDKNESYSSIKSQITAKVKQLPFTTVSAGAADYVVRTAVKLYCPGYTSRTN